ncbi:GMC oxidoreductase [Lentinula boryana]|uniref:GMC oxidoreductase n=1 Tax=Lentinula boryana TaxID=40481 RepID=A0ABQ8Q0I2_9AGAR|nr:GMC oxidoreductase [Lentinula boryana]
MWLFLCYAELSREVSDEYDFIVVGGGTAGAASANRLSAQEANKVLLIERGPVADNWASRVPLLSADFASDGSRTRKVLSAPQNILGRSLEFGWGWENIKPYLKSERALYPSDPSVHNTEGILRLPRAQPKISDINSPVHPVIGCGLLHFTRDKNQHRSSTYSAFHPMNLVLQRASRLHIVTHTDAIKLTLKPDTSPDKLDVEGVILKSSLSPGKRSLKARKEVILCVGPFGSPQLSMLSSVSEKDITLVKDLPAVGSNLQDHFGVSVAFEVPMSHSLLSLRKQPWTFFIELFKYLLFGTGMLLAPVLQMALFASSTLLDRGGLPKSPVENKPSVLPDIEIMPVSVVFYSLYLHYSRQGYSLKDFGVPDGEDDASLDKFICKRNRMTYHCSSTCRMGPDNGKEDGGVVNEELFVHGFESSRGRFFCSCRSSRGKVCGYGSLKIPGSLIQGSEYS